MSKQTDSKSLKPSQILFKSTIQKIPYPEKINNSNININQIESYYKSK